MKKLNLLFIAFALSVFVLSSCKKDTEAPTITVTPSDDTVKVDIGEIVKYTVNWSCPDPILTAKITYNAGTSKIILDTTFPAEVKSFDYNLQVEITNAIPVGTTIEFTYFGNSKDNSTFLTKYVFVKGGMSTYEGVKLQAQADGEVTAGTNLSFYASSMNKGFTLNQVANADTAAFIDLVFTHHTIFKDNIDLSFQSPNSAKLHQMWAEFPGFNPPYDYNIDNKKQTYFKKVDVTDWDNLNHDAIETVVGNIETEVKVRGINIGDFIAFETHKGNKGIIKVTNTEISTNPYNETYITFDVKVQK